MRPFEFRTWPSVIFICLIGQLHMSQQWHVVLTFFGLSTDNTQMASLQTV